MLLFHIIMIMMLDDNENNYDDEESVCDNNDYVNKECKGDTLNDNEDDRKR